MNKTKKVVELRPKDTLASILTNRMDELSGRKSIAEVADEIGLPSSNFFSMVKKGKSKLALNRVEETAKALELDFDYLFIAALRQYYDDDVITLMRRTFGNSATKTEAEILELARNNMDTTDNLSNDSRRALVQVFRDNKPAGR